MTVCFQDQDIIKKKLNIFARLKQPVLEIHCFYFKKQRAFFLFEYLQILEIFIYNLLKRRKLVLAEMLDENIQHPNFKRTDISTFASPLIMELVKCFCSVKKTLSRHISFFRYKIYKIAHFTCLNASGLMKKH